jgi:hypothetical protein
MITQSNPLLRPPARPRHEPDGRACGKACSPRVTVLWLALGLAFTAGLASPQVGAAQIIQFLSTPQRFETGTIWFQTRQETGGMRGSGIVELGSSFFQTAPAPSLPIYQGGSFSWTPSNVFLTLVGGGLTTVEVLTPTGASITDTQGIVPIAFAFLVTFDTSTSLVISAVLNGAAYVYTPNNVYLVLVGGGLTTVEVTSPTGGALAGVKGISLVAGAVDDDPNTPAVDAITQGGALVYTDSNVFLNLVGGGLVTVEVLSPAGAAISKTLGIARMDGFTAPPGAGPLQGAAYLWTQGQVLLVLIGGGLTTVEVTAPGGGSIPRAWGVMKLDANFTFSAGGVVFQGAAEIVTETNLYLTLAGGGISTSEITAPAGGPIATNVRVGSSTFDIRQASELYAKAGLLLGPPVRGGTIIGLDQGQGGGT